jgi:NAD(P)-dependent dehydrogenase (short-subunit alcohol dehydrogenase family)
MHELGGKSIIVTGAGRGIGAAIAVYCARLGARIVVNDVDAQAADKSVAEIRRGGGEAVACIVDIRSWKAAGGLIDCCLNAFGTVDGLVNNAGLFAMGRIDELADGDVTALVEVNINGTVNCAAHAVRQMKRQGHGAIVNVTSGAQMGIPALGIYGATKAAVAALTYAWALELRELGIRVNAVSPMAKTEMAASTDSYMRRHGREPVQVPDISPSVNAPLVAYLLSEAAADLSGQVVRIEGGQLSLMTHPAVLLPILQSELWTFDAIAAAFEGDLRDRLVPLGIAGVKVNAYAGGSRFWAETDI